MSLARHILLLLMLCMASVGWAQDQPTDSVVQKGRVQRIKDKVKQHIEDKLNEPYDTVRDNGYWFRALKHGKVDFTNGTIDYPPFIDFCWKVYKWGDRAFNSYDTAYVVGTGKNWKLIANNNNWLDSYVGEPIKGAHIALRSNVNANLGLQLSFMAVSAGLTFGVSGKKHSKKAEFSFTCARFAAQAYYLENNNDVTMVYWKKHISDRNTIKGFGGLKRKQYGLSAYYFFNNRRYAQAAAYCYSKYQKRSAGSFIAGFNLQHHEMRIALEELPQFIREQVPEGEQIPRFIYNDYCVMLGYGYNWVLGRKWLLNATLSPYIGYRHLINTSHEDKASAWSINGRVRAALVYNHKQFFAGAQNSLDLHRYKSKNHYFVSSLLDVTFLAGIRF